MGLGYLVKWPVNNKNYYCVIEKAKLKNQREDTKRTQKPT